MSFIKKIGLPSVSIFIVALTCFIIDFDLKLWEKQVKKHLGLRGVRKQKFRAFTKLEHLNGKLEESFKK